MVPLGDLGGGTGEAFSISADGQVDRRQVLERHGRTRLPLDRGDWDAEPDDLYSGSAGSGSYLQYANAVSGDGVHVVGYGYNRSRNRYEAYCTH